MEEILASIRRIIADDDATKTVPQQAEQPRAEAHPAPLPPQSVPSHAMPSHAMPQPEPVQYAPRVAPPVAEPEPLPEESVDEALAEQGADILDLTEFDGGAHAATFSRAHAQSRTTVPHYRWQFRRRLRRGGRKACGCTRCKSARTQRRRARTASLAPEHGGGRFSLQRAGADCARTKCPHARRSGSRHASADAEKLARRQSARHGRAPGASRDRAGFARAKRLISILQRGSKP